MTGSLFALAAILGALHGRARTGEGCEIDLALADVVMPLQLLALADFGSTGRSPERGGTYLNGGAAYYRIYRTAGERFVFLGAVEPKFWVNFCEAAGHAEWIDHRSDPIPQTELANEIAAFFETTTLAQSNERFSSADCCVSPVLNLAEAMSSGRIAERGLVRSGPDGDLQALFPALIDGQVPTTRKQLSSM